MYLPVLLSHACLLPYLSLAESSAKISSARWLLCKARHEMYMQSAICLRTLPQLLGVRTLRFGLASLCRKASAKFPAT